MIMTVAMRFGKHQALFDELTARLNAVAKENEKLKQYAELGRLAAKIVESGAYLAINTYNSCHPEADAYTECECRKNCPWNEFCKLRAEMEEGNGSE